MRCKAMGWRGGEQVEGLREATHGYTSLPQVGGGCHTAANNSIWARQAGVRVQRQGLHGRAIKPRFPHDARSVSVSSHMIATSPVWLMNN